MENDAVSHVMTAESSSAATCTAASGRFFTISELAGNHGLARLLDERRNRVLDGQLEVGRLKRKGVVVRVEVDARQNGKRRSGCDALEHHGQRVLQFRLVDAEFQDVPFL